MSTIDSIRVALKHPKRALSAIVYRITKNIWNHKDYKRFIILTRARTGSNMLLAMLKSHPNIYAKGEIFRNLNGRDMEEVLNDIFSPQPKYIKSVGFKIFYYHQSGTELWQMLKEMQDLYIIHLKRSNTLRTLTSRKIAGKQDIWLQTSNYNDVNVKEKRVKFSFEELEEGFRLNKKWEDEYEAMFSDHKLITLKYEDIVDNPDTEFAKVTNLLNLKFSSPKVYTIKQNPESLSNLIVNYKVLKKQFSGTKWQSYFED